jgi:hypothetical protein
MHLAAAGTEADDGAAVEIFVHLPEQTVQGVPPTDLASKRANIATMVSACWKNPSAKDMSDVQHLLYCSLPLEFRLCNSIILGETSAATAENAAKRRKAYTDCASSSGLSKLLVMPALEAAYADLFLDDGKGLRPEFVADLVKAHPVVVMPEPFPVLLDRMINYYVDSHGGLTEARGELVTILTPAVEHPEVVADAAAAAVGAGRTARAAGKAALEVGEITMAAMPRALLPGI